MNLKILKNVRGLRGNNDIVFVGGHEPPKFNVIYFGGDIQDLKKEMKNYIDYCIEWSASMLYNRYKELKCSVHVYAVRPSLYRYSTYSMFKKFC